MGLFTVHIVYLYKDYYPVMGGIEAHLRTLGEGIVAQGDRVSVVVCQPAGQHLADYEEMHGVAIYRVPRHIDLASSPFSYGLTSIVRQLRPDLIHLQMPWPGGDVALLTTRTPYIVTYQSDIVRQNRLLQLYAPLLRHTLQRARAIITTSPQYRDSSPWLSAYREKCHVIPLGIAAPAASDTARVAYWRARFPASCVLWVGRMRYYKGLHVLMDALAHTPDTLEVALVGDGPMRDELQQRAHARGVAARVHFLGALADVDVRALQEVARYFVFPSHVRAEAFGLAMLEALYSGLPAISCEIGTATSFVNQHDATGIVVPPSDAHALGQAMTRLWQDYALRQRYATHAPHWAAVQFSAARMITDTRALYTRVLESHA